MTDDTLTFIPINDKLKALGVLIFARKSNVIDIGFKGGQTVVFDIDPKKVTNTRDNFEKEAKRYPGFSKSTISKVSLVLLDSTNNYLQYLLYSKAAPEAQNGKGDQQHHLGPKLNLTKSMSNLGGFTASENRLNSLIQR